MEIFVDDVDTTQESQMQQKKREKIGLIFELRCALATWMPTNFISFEFISVAIEFGNRRHNVYIVVWKRVRNMFSRYDSIRSFLCFSSPFPSFILGWVFPFTAMLFSLRRNMPCTYDCAYRRVYDVFTFSKSHLLWTLCYTYYAPCVACNTVALYTHI